ncbi:MAG: hypothetical protein ACFFB5_20675 [Promethearchaeota archaeon]
MEIGTYQGKKLVQSEINVLKEIEKSIGTPVPYFKHQVINLGFSTEGNHIKQLILNYIELESLPKNIGNLIHLIELHLKGNNLKKLPETFGQLRQLKYLVLSKNNLEVLPDSFNLLTNLEDVRLRENNLKKLPEELSGLENLEVLDLGQNNLTSLPESLCTLPKLGSLTLDNNSLASLPDNLYQLENLTYLDVNSNTLKELPDSFGKLTNLNVFKANDNKLRKLPYNFGKCIKLQQIQLARNDLKSLPDSLIDIEKLTRLRLSYNQIEKLSYELWETFSQISIFSISENPLNFADFRRIRWKVDSTNQKFIQFLIGIGTSVFTEVPIHELEEIIEPDDKISRLAHKSAHQNYLNLGTSLTRAFYATMIGSGLLRYYDTSLSEALNLPIYFLILIPLLLGFSLTLRLSVQKENEISDLRQQFVHKSLGHPAYNLDIFEELLKEKYFSLESELKSSRYNAEIGFFSNLIISCITTVIFTVLAVAGTNYINVIVLLFSPSMWPPSFIPIIIVLICLTLISMPILWYLFSKSLPSLNFELRSLLIKYIEDYDIEREKHEREESRMKY